MTNLPRQMETLFRDPLLYDVGSSPQSPDPADSIHLAMRVHVEDSPVRTMSDVAFKTVIEFCLAHLLQGH